MGEIANPIAERWQQSLTSLLWKWFSAFIEVAIQLSHKFQGMTIHANILQLPVILSSQASIPPERHLPVQAHLPLFLCTSIPGINDKNSSESHVGIRNCSGKSLVVMMTKGTHANPIKNCWRFRNMSHAVIWMEICS